MSYKINSIKTYRLAFVYDEKDYFFNRRDRKMYVFNTKIERLVPNHLQSMTGQNGLLACKEVNKIKTDVTNGQCILLII